MAGIDVAITGIGILTALGEGVDAHAARLSGPDAAAPAVDDDRFAPYSVHPLPAVDWSRQIERKGDQRQMEAWQRIGVYAAGLALADAGMKGDESACASMDMTVAAGGGERDQSVDEMILANPARGSALGAMLNERLMTDLRPTLFLAQLSNLLAGNISIVHKVTGSSRTFMGEEGAGISALATAAARIRAGQSTHALVGASYNAEHPDMLLNFELGGRLHRGGWAPAAERTRAQGGGVVTGSGGVFLVLEARERAEARGASIHALVRTVSGDQGSADGEADRLRALIERSGAGTADMIISATSGGHVSRLTEAEALAAAAPFVPVRTPANVTGHLREAQALLAVALSAIALSRGEPWPRFAESENDVAPGAPQRIAVTLAGLVRGEGVAVLERA